MWWSSGKICVCLTRFGTKSFRTGTLRRFLRWNPGSCAAAELPAELLFRKAAQLSYLAPVYRKLSASYLDSILVSRSWARRVREPTRFFLRNASLLVWWACCVVGVRFVGAFPRFPRSCVPPLTPLLEHYCCFPSCSAVSVGRSSSPP